jgi:hypothetical protein
VIFWLIIVAAILLVSAVGVVTVRHIRYHGPIRGTEYVYRPYKPRHNERGK